jgi:hypothetical protein
VTTRDKALSLAIVGAVLLAIGVLSRHWWTGEMMPAKIKLGLRNAEVCVLVACTTVSYADAEELSARDTNFVTLAKLTFYVGLLGAFALALHAYLRGARGETRAAPAAGLLCAGTGALAIATVVTLPDEAGPLVSLGWSFPVTMLGAIFGCGSALPRLVPARAMAGFHGAVAGVRDRVHRAALGKLATLSPDTEQPREDFPSATIAPPPRDRVRYDEKLERDRPDRDRLTSLPMGRREQQLNLLKSRGVAADKVARSIRFVATEVQITHDGLRVDELGHQRLVSWAAIERLVARRLPPDPPFHALMMLDIIAKGDPAPIRLLPSTRVNYGALSGDPAAAAVDNLRRLAARLARQAGSAGGVQMDDATTAFALDGQPPARFVGESQFHEYDRQFG